MSSQPEWWGSVRLLLGVARSRWRGRRQAMIQRGRRAGVGYGISVVVHILLQGAIAGLFLWITHVAVTVRTEQQGAMVISHQHLRELQQYEATAVESTDAPMVRALHEEAESHHTDRGGTVEDWDQRLRDRYATRGSAGFVDTDAAEWPNADSGRLLALLLVAWWLSMALQGESYQVDVTRRRHPMWEWYLGFPVPQSAVFVAEALTPAVGQPMLLTSPVLPAVLAGVLWHSWLAGLCALPIGIVLLLTATLWSKALEVLIMLRCPVRSRGAWFAVMSFAGGLAMIGPFLLLQFKSLLYAGLGSLLPLIAAWPSALPLLDTADPANGFVAMVVALGIGIALGLPAVLVMRVATLQGLESGFGEDDVRREAGSFALRGRGLKGWLSDPLLRKERLWLRRDRGALVQLIGVPMILVAGQFANFHNLLESGDSSWNRIAGLVFFFGAMLIATAGPRVLLSEGPALMLTLSWPRSLEDTLRMKVRVLFALVTAMIYVCLGVLIWMFPHDAFAIIAVGLLWPWFGLSVAEKAVTLIRAPGTSGEPEPIPLGRRFLTGIGNSTFAIAIGTGQWPLAFTAIALNWVLAGAVWEGFRSRLPYLFDQDAEPVVRPPTILSGVLALAGYQELAALISIPFFASLGSTAAPFILPIAYGVSAIVTCIVVVIWHERQRVGVRELLTLDEAASLLPARACALGVLAGTLLAVVGTGYQRALFELPWPAVHESLVRSARLLAEHPAALTAYAILAVGVAPWVEEFLFRGLLFRAMLPQWGLWRSVLASAAFFAALHPMVAWPMVFPLGVACALLYRRSRSLLPGMLLHACYNGLLLYLSYG